jgi:hypothetical protein
VKQPPPAGQQPSISYLKVRNTARSRVVREQAVIVDGNVGGAKFKCLGRRARQRFWKMYGVYSVLILGQQRVASRRHNGLTFSLLLDNNRKRPKRRLLKYRKYSRCPRYPEPKNTHLGSRKCIRRGKVNNRTVACVRSRELESTN